MANMVFGSKGEALTKSFDKWTPKAFHGQGEKYWTVGWGHYGPDVYSGEVVSDAQGEILFKKDIASAQASVNRKIKVPLNQNQFDALVDFSFNVGNDAFPTLVNLLNSGNYKAVPAQMMRFDVKPVGDKLGLDRRHSADVKLWNTPPSTAQKTATPAKTNANTNGTLDAKKKADAKIISDKAQAKIKLDLQNKQKAIDAKKVLDQATLSKNKSAIAKAQANLDLINKANKPEPTPAKKKVVLGGFSVLGLIVTVIFFKYGFDL